MKAGPQRSGRGAAGRGKRRPGPGPEPRPVARARRALTQVRRLSPSSARSRLSTLNISGRCPARCCRRSLPATPRLPLTRRGWAAARTRHYGPAAPPARACALRPPLLPSPLLSSPRLAAPRRCCRGAGRRPAGSAALPELRYRRRDPAAGRVPALGGGRARAAGRDAAKAERGPAAELSPSAGR